MRRVWPRERRERVRRRLGCRHDRCVRTSCAHGQVVQGSSPSPPGGAGLERQLASLRDRAQPPAAPHASLPCGAAARRPPLVTRAAQEMDWPLCLYAAMSLRRYVSTLLCRCVAMSLRCYVATPLCRYAAMPLSVFAATSLCREMCTRVCDGRALRMCVMAVQRCTGVVGTCVARPRPQSAFANG